MVRLQIQLEAARHREVKRRAKRLGISVSEVIRRCVDAQIQDEDVQNPGARARKAIAVAGKYRDPEDRSDVAAAHDAVLAEAFGPARRPGAARP